MSLWELQEKVSAWAAHNFPTETRQTVVLGLAEETGELCRAALKHYQGYRGTPQEWEQEARKEVGDVFLKLVHVCQIWGFDLEDVINDRWSTIKQRNFIADPIGHGLPEDR